MAVSVRSISLDCLLRNIHTNNFPPAPLESIQKLVSNICGSHEDAAEVCSNQCTDSIEYPNAFNNLLLDGIVNH